VHERREQRFERIGEIPFTSERKMMSTIEVDHERGDERVLIAKGPPTCCSNAARTRASAWTWWRSTKDCASASCRCRRAHRRRAAHAGGRLPPARSDEDTDPQDPMQIERDLVFAGTVGIIDPPREEAAQAIGEAHRAGIRVIMITGEHRALRRGLPPISASSKPRGCADRGRDRPARRRGLCRSGAQHLGVRPRGAGSQAAHRRRAAGRRQRRRDDRRRRQRRTGTKSADIGVAMGVTGTEVTKEAAG